LGRDSGGSAGLREAGVAGCYLFDHRRPGNIASSPRGPCRCVYGGAVNRMATGVALCAIAALAVAGVAGSNRFSGPVLVGIGTHGVHLGDLAVLLIALTGGLAVLYRGEG
jgi:hypothetical protein